MLHNLWQQKYTIQQCIVQTVPLFGLIFPHMVLGSIKNIYILRNFLLRMSLNAKYVHRLVRTGLLVIGTQPT